jgi:hypothetical protein
LWSGEPFAFQGRHYRVEETMFSPTPVQQPIPVWIAGRWPARRPFRRAARWQGLFGTHRDVGLGQTMSPDQLEEIVRFIRAQRTDEAAFDIVIEGATDGPGDPSADRVSTYAGVGLTWWVEQLTWVRGSLDHTRGRIERGPPRHG